MKLTLLIFILIQTVSLDSFSQLKNVGAYFSPTYNYGTINKNGETCILFNTGLTFEKEITPKISFSSGLEYSKEGFNNENIIFKYSIESRLNHIGIPIQMNYYFFSKHDFKVGLFLGIKLKQLISAQFEYLKYKEGYNDSNNPLMITILENYKRKELKSINYNTINYDFLYGLHFIYSFNHFSIGLSPEFRQSILPTNEKEIGYYFHDYFDVTEKLRIYGLRFLILKK